MLKRLILIISVIFIFGSFPQIFSEVQEFDTDSTFVTLSSRTGIGPSLEINLDMIKIGGSIDGMKKITTVTSKAILSKNVEFDKTIPEDWKPYEIPKVSKQIEEDSSKFSRVKISIILKDSPKLPSDFQNLSPSEKSMKTEERKGKIKLMQQPILGLLENSGATGIKPNLTINSIDVEIPSSLLDELVSYDEILTIRESVLDHPVFPAVDESRMYEGIESFWVDQILGSGKLAAIIDTGVDRTHPDLDDIDNDPGTFDPKITNEHYVSISGTDPSDCDPAGHGTSVAGIIGGTGELNPFLKGFQPETSIMSIRTFDANCIGFISFFVDGFQHVLDYNSNPSTTQPVDVINVSGGSCQLEDGGDDISLIADQAYDNGIAVFAASGNIPLCTHVFNPASAHKVFSVGALDQVDLEIWDNSLGGPTTDGRIKPEVVAVHDITGLVPGGSYSTDDIKLGTSFAVPQVTASFLALDELFDRDLGINLEPGRAYSIFLSSANGTASGSLGLRMDNEIGAGLINLHNNIETSSGFVTLSDDDTLSLFLNLPTGTTRVSAAIWWPESFGQIHNDIDLTLHKNPVPNSVGSSISINSVAERIIILNPSPGDYTLEINAVNIPAPNVNQEIFYAYSIETFDPCLAPAVGEWIISINCVLTSSQTPPDNVKIENSGSLTIPEDLTLDVDLENNNIVIESGGKVIVKKGGRIK